MEPLLAKYGVDLSIWAHEHSYERLYPVYNYTVYNDDNAYVNPKSVASYCVRGKRSKVLPPSNNLVKQNVY